MNEKAQVTCSECGALLADDYDPLDRSVVALDPCPECGSTRRTVHRHLLVVSTAYPSVRGIVKRPGFKRGGRVVEFLSGIVPSAAYAWVKKTWRLDRAANRYQERVETLDGEVIHDVDEELDQHYDHGSSKFKKQLGHSKEDDETT